MRITLSHEFTCCSSDGVVSVGLSDVPTIVVSHLRPIESGELLRSSDEDNGNSGENEQDKTRGRRAASTSSIARKVFKITTDYPIPYFNTRVAIAKMKIAEQNK